MEKLLSLFTKKEDNEHSDPFEFLEEEFLFKHNFRRYSVRKLKECIEFWARSTRPEDITPCYFIGKIIRGTEKITLAKYFHTYPWEIQKAGGKLIRMYMYGEDL